jgi:hypothetical protein
VLANYGERMDVWWEFLLVLALFLWRCSGQWSCMLCRDGAANDSEAKSTVG